MSPLTKDYLRSVSEMERKNLLRSTFTDDCRTQKGDQKTCLLWGLINTVTVFWKVGHLTMPSSWRISAKRLVCLMIDHSRLSGFSKCWVPCDIWRKPLPTDTFFHKRDTEGKLPESDMSWSPCHVTLGWRCSSEDRYTPILLQVKVYTRCVEHR